MFRTHAAAGVFAALFFINSFSLNHPVFFFFVVLLSSLLPDIDLPNSKIGQRFKPLSMFLNFMFGHRKLFHSFLFSFLFSFILIILFENYIGAAFLLGYTVHLIIDGLTVRGIKPFYPISDVRLPGHISKIC